VGWAITRFFGLVVLARVSERDEVNLYGSPPFFFEIIGDAPTNVF
jgi:hypothetical protein